MNCAHCGKEFKQGDVITFVIYYGLTHVGDCEHAIYREKVRGKDFTVTDLNSILDYVSRGF